MDGLADVVEEDGTNGLADDITEGDTVRLLDGLVDVAEEGDTDGRLYGLVDATEVGDTDGRFVRA
jgi:hypothetical protein